MRDTFFLRGLGVGGRGRRAMGKRSRSFTVCVCVCVCVFFGGVSFICVCIYFTWKIMGFVYNTNRYSIASQILRCLL